MIIQGVQASSLKNLKIVTQDFFQKIRQIEVRSVLLMYNVNKLSHLFIHIFSTENLLVYPVYLKLSKKQNVKKVSLLIPN